MARPGSVPAESDAPVRVLVVGTARAAREAWSRLLDAPDQTSAVGIVPARTRDEQPLRDNALPIVGDASDLADLIRVHAIDLVLLAIPRAMHELSAELSRSAAGAGARVEWLPPLSDALAGRTGHTPRTLDLGALIGRDPRPIDGSLVDDVAKGKRVLITGAGGSIGSELARIVARHAPAELILMDRSENALFEIDRELGAAAPRINRRVVLHDVVDRARTLALLEDIAPHAVIHAAAHKHVPMMEDHPGAAVTNNVFGTRAVLDGAIDAGAERFVLVSTDKAVRPTSVMGATKRLAEHCVRSRAPHTSTRCSVVRFGNVLGSACSVLPIWERQIGAGGPLTITDARMTRYFMTIPEAASLVLQSSALAQRGDAGVYVLDMGEPIRVVDLAQRLLAQLGLSARDADVPERNAVEIRVTGIRPGEKLYEELAYATEELRDTSVPGVRAWTGGAPDAHDVDTMLRALDAVRASAAPDDVIAVLRTCVPEMRPVEDTPAHAPIVCPTADFPNTTLPATTHAA